MRERASLSSVPDHALKAAQFRLAGDPEKRVQWMPNLIDHLNKAGHVAELLTCNADTMKSRLVHIAKLRHERSNRELGDAAPAFNENDWVFPTLDPAKTYVVGFNFIPKHVKEVYDEHFAQAGFEVIFVDAAHLRRGPGHGYKGGVCCVLSPVGQASHSIPSACPLRARSTRRDYLCDHHGQCQPEHCRAGLLVQV